MSLIFAEGGDRAPRRRLTPAALLKRVGAKARGAGAPTTSVNPLSQRNCYRPRTRTTCRWSGAARGAWTPVQASVGALALASDSASQLSVTLCFVSGVSAYTKAG